MEDLYRQAASNEHDGPVTLSKAMERGLEWDSDPPPVKYCKACNTRLEPTGICLGRKVILWQPASVPTRCTCETAQKFWKDYDKKQELKKEAEKNAIEKRAEMENVNALMNGSGLGERFKKRTFENFMCDTAGRKNSFKIAKSFSDNFSIYSKTGSGLYFEGTNGTGKTHLAAAIAIDLLNRQIPVIFRTCTDLLKEIKQEYNTNEKGITDIYRKVDLLIIDDLGKEQCTDWAISELYSIINARYEDMKPTIVTTNYNETDLVKVMTPKGQDDGKIKAIISRLHETSAVVTMAWEDIRRQRNVT